MREFLRSPRALVVGFFLLLCVVGLLSFERYGVSWDEPNMVGVGELAYASVFQGQPWATEPSKRFYGPAFELILSAVRHAGKMTDERTVLLMRHALTFAAFIAGTVGFYALVKRRFGSWRAGLLGAGMLVLSPRIFSEAFYNSKDIPSMCLFILAMLTMQIFLERRTFRSAILHGVASGLVVSVRITGIIVPAITLMLLTLQILATPSPERDVRHAMRAGGLFLLLSALCTYLFWPFLWTHPIAHFLEAWRFMGGQGAGGLYMGRMLSGHLPWHYVVVWIAITTPLLYSFLFLAGLTTIVARFLRERLHWFRHAHTDLLVLSWFFLPIVSLILSGAGIFDGWRHMYFIYPAFLLIALDGTRALSVAARSLLGRYGFPLERADGVIAAALLLPMLSTALWMYRNHPIQNMYFSLPKSMVEGNFELDYWGLSFRRGFEMILAQDTAPTIPVYATSSPGFYSYAILPPEQKNRIVMSDETSARYILDNFRSNQYQKKYDLPEVGSVVIDGIIALTIYRTNLR